MEETDWNKANGRLQSPKDTIDGSLPTFYSKENNNKSNNEENVLDDDKPESQQEQQGAVGGGGGLLFELIKKNLTRQRGFDVVDVSNQNLLYTTRGVPGTLAWFDVLGPKSCGSFEDLQLRVQVDLARRTWIVYRYHTPVFDGQVPILLHPPPSSSNDNNNNQEAVKLYKTACVTMSWSRFSAVVARYGPPRPEDFPEVGNDSSDDDDNVASTNNNNNSNSTKTKMGDFDDENDENKAPNPPLPPLSSSLPQSPSQNETVLCKAGTPLATNQPPREPSPTKQQTQNAAYRQAMEGVIDMDQPMLQCQEIYNRIIGNHQTFLVNKEELMKLLQTEEEEQDSEYGAAPFQTKGYFQDPLRDAVELEKQRRYRKQHHLKEEEKGNDVEENTKSSNVDDDDDDNKEEPLVAYWNWQNTVMVHKIQMHLAKNSDLALHVVLAILANQVRTERNALALTL